MELYFAAATCCFFILYNNFMIRNGSKPLAVDHRDFDLHKSFGNVGMQTPEFLAEYMTDAGLWTPDQNASEPIFNNPPLEYGCVEYCSGDVSADEDLTLKNPMQMEELLHYNAKGGGDVRAGLECARTKLGWNKNYYAIKAFAPLDYFDAIRLAMSSGIPEKRSVSLGTPWWPTFEKVGTDGILNIPVSFKSTTIATLPWHNHKICGWKTINGSPYLISKSWQGPNYGDKGFVYFSRSLINSIMAIEGTCAFTVTQAKPLAIKTIDISTLRWLLSLIGYQY